MVIPMHERFGKLDRYPLREFEKEYNSRHKDRKIMFEGYQSIGGAPCRYEKELVVLENDPEYGYKVLARDRIGYVIEYPYTNGSVFDVIIDYDGDNKLILSVLEELVSYLRSLSS